MWMPASMSSWHGPRRRGKKKNKHNRRKHRTQPKLATAEDNALPGRSKLP